MVQVNFVAVGHTNNNVNFYSFHNLVELFIIKLIEQFMIAEYARYFGFRKTKDHTVLNTNYSTHYKKKKIPRSTGHRIMLRCIIDTALSYRLGLEKWKCGVQVLESGKSKLNKNWRDQ